MANDGRNYYEQPDGEQSDGAYKILEALGLGSEYIRWAESKLFSPSAY